MKTVLLTWELGANLGHVGPLLRIAKGLAARGHRPVFALRDVVGSRALLEGEPFAVLQAPRFADGAFVRGRPFRPSGYADNLAAFGWSDEAALAALVRSWDGLLELVRPDLIVADHSPTVCLAAYGGVPVAVVGSGYTVPPADGTAFPRLYPDRQPLMSESRLLENASGVQRRRGRPAPASLPALFDAPLRAVATLAELDPYRDVRREPLLGPIEPMPAFGAAPGGGGVFAYLGEEHPGLIPAVHALVALGRPVEAYLRGNVGGLRGFLASQGHRVHEKPPRLDEVMGRCSTVVSHAGATTAHAALLAGRPHVALPTHIEADLTASALERLGVGLRLGLNATEREISQALDRVLPDDAPLRANASMQAAALSRVPRIDGAAAVADGCSRLL